MKTFAIYFEGRCMDTINAYTADGALAHFVDDNPMFRFSNLETMELYVP